MKKFLSLVLVVSAIFALSGCSLKSNKVAGIYHCENWNNNGEAAIFLNGDGSCFKSTVSPFSDDDCKWKQDGDTIKITYTIGGTTDEKNAVIVDGGIVYYGHFFKKLK